MERCGIEAWRVGGRQRKRVQTSKLSLQMRLGHFRCWRFRVVWIMLGLSVVSLSLRRSHENMSRRI